MTTVRALSKRPTPTPSGGRMPPSPSCRLQGDTPIAPPRDRDPNPSRGDYHILDPHILSGQRMPSKPSPWIRTRLVRSQSRSRLSRAPVSAFSTGQAS